jgi:uncharacterized membrane protein
MNLQQKNQKNNATQSQMALQQTTHYSGVLPPPEALQKYEHLLKGTAERLLTLAEKEAEHRRELTAQGMKRYYFSYNLGQIFGFTISLSFIVSATICILKEENITGLLLGLGGLSGIISSLIWGYKRKSNSGKQ